MGAIPQKVLNWMYNVLRGVCPPFGIALPLLTTYQEYQNPDRTYSDVAQTLNYNPNFSLRTSVYSTSQEAPIAVESAIDHALKDCSL